MSTITAPRPYRPGTPDDPYYYGFRDVPKPQPDGSLTFERFPLTLEDCLHPQMGDKIVENPLHDLVREYLAYVLRARVAADKHALVLSNAGVYWDDPDLGHHVPDVAVIFDVKDWHAKRESFKVADEGTRPRMIIEVVSPKLRDNDVKRKFADYHRAGVAIYVIVDRVSNKRSGNKRVGDKWRLVGYRHTSAKYVSIPTDHRGWLWLEPVGLWLGLKGDVVALYDGKTGLEVVDYLEMTHERDAAKARADAEATARLAAERRIRELEEQLKHKS